MDAILCRMISLTLMFVLCKVAIAKGFPPSTDHVSFAITEATNPWADWKAAAIQIVAATGQAAAAATTTS